MEKEHNIQKRLLATVAILLITVSGIWAQESQTAYNFLRLPVSAHAAALGGENITVIEDDPSLVFSNPALAASVSDKSIGLGYTNYAGIHYGSANYTKTIGEKGTLVGGAQYANYGKMKQVDENNVQTGEFSASDISINATFAYTLAKNLVGGITAKAILSYLGDYNSMAVGVDLGLNYYDPEHDWSVSMVAKNLGGQVKAYDDIYEKMPFDFQIGVSKTMQGLPVRFSATLVDMTHFNYRFVNHLCLGADIMLSDQIWIGGGYSFRKSEEMTIVSHDEESSHAAGLSVGAGISLERFKLNLSYGKQHVSAASLMMNAAFTL